MNDSISRAIRLALAMLATCIGVADARADEIIKLGLSLPLSGPGVVWGKGDEWMCKRAAEEVRAAGGFKIKGQVYNFECVSYDNKYTAGEGAKVAQTMINRDGIKIVNVMGTATVAATQSLSERQGVLLFMESWGRSIKGPKFPMSFSAGNGPLETFPVLAKVVLAAHPQIKTIALLNPNDSTGHECEAVSRAVWEKAGVNVVSSDFYERGTTEFQPIASRMAALKADAVSLGASPTADAGAVLKELDVRGWKGVKILDAGTGADSLKATAGASANDVYMGAAVTFDAPETTAYQRKVNDEARAYLGDSLNEIHICFYDVVYAIKAAMEKAQSIAPADVAKALPTSTYRSFYGTDARYGGADVYGSPMQAQLPVIISQVVDGKLVQRARVVPDIK